MLFSLEKLIKVFKYSDDLFNQVLRNFGQNFYIKIVEKLTIIFWMTSSEY